ncbi:hypothetical protein MMO39_04600 [Acinetobacter modestus]|uniref:hypothetical protein n=1 Tax=Acinetobacter modestus TaxID=1776740 RepID=UPI001F4AD2A8|nr:hypothetical protein [Acinetobacter modestus]MCH7386580.1 hypothetical protein [Acinetobacter modestus]
MVSHIKKLCNSYCLAIDSGKNEHEGVSTFDWPKLIYSEIKDLRTADFEPHTRYDFVLLKANFHKLANKGSFSHNELPSFSKAARALEGVLDNYAKGGEYLLPQKFDFIHDDELKKIIQRDYRELHFILMPDEAWKSAVVMCGSIIESILYDVLSQINNINKVNSSKKAPKNNSGIIEINSGKWKLINLIEVAVDIGVLPAQRAASIDQVLRDYRNFVHPQKEIKSKHPCTEAEAYMAKGCLDGVCNHLSSLLS